MEENMGYRGNLHDKYFQINFYFPRETLKFYPYTYRRQRKEQRSNVKTRLRKLTLMAQYCRKEIKLYGYETKEMRNKQFNIKIKNKQRN